MSDDALTAPVDLHDRQGRRRRDDYPTTWPGMALEFIRRHGVMAGFVAYLIWQMSGNFQRSLDTLNQRVNDHSYYSFYTMRQLCINTAIQAGQNPAACDPPPPQRDRENH